LAQATAGRETSCPTCGFTQADFKKSGRLGCGDCYTTFADGLESLLKTMHKGTRHVGKAPHITQPSRLVQDSLKLLQTQLDQAVAAERFEEAARLRDQIKLLKEAGTGVLAA
jgi:protein arginine kinase activator